MQQVDTLQNFLDLVYAGRQAATIRPVSITEVSSTLPELTCISDDDACILLVLESKDPAFLVLSQGFKPH